MEQYDKYQDFQIKTATNQENWLKQITQFEENTQKSLVATQEEYESKLRAKSSEINRVCITIEKRIVSNYYFSFRRK